MEGLVEVRRANLVPLARLLRAFPQIADRVGSLEVLRSVRATVGAWHNVVHMDALQID